MVQWKSGPLTQWGLRIHFSKCATCKELANSCLGFSLVSDAGCVYLSVDWWFDMFTYDIEPRPASQSASVYTIFTVYKLSKQIIQGSDMFVVLMFYETSLCLRKAQQSVSIFAQVTLIHLWISKKQCSKPSQHKCISPLCFSKEKQTQRMHLKISICQCVCVCRDQPGLCYALSNMTKRRSCSGCTLVAGSTAAAGINKSPLGKVDTEAHMSPADEYPAS